MSKERGFTTDENLPPRKPEETPRPDNPGAQSGGVTPDPRKPGVTPDPESADVGGVTPDPEP